MALTAAERYDRARPSYTRVNGKRFADLDAGTTILIPSPRDIEAEIARLSPGETLDLTALRRRLAERHDADGACPVMTGMNLRIVAERALDHLDSGADTEEVAPFWRAVAPDSALAKKLPGGSERITDLRRADTSA